MGHDWLSKNSVLLPSKDILTLNSTPPLSHEVNPSSTLVRGILSFLQWWAKHGTTDRSNRDPPSLPPHRLVETGTQYLYAASHRTFRFVGPASEKPSNFKLMSTGRPVTLVLRLKQKLLRGHSKLAKNTGSTIQFLMGRCRRNHTLSDLGLDDKKAIRIEQMETARARIQLACFIVAT